MTDVNKKIMTLHFTDGRSETAPLEHGPEGFAFAAFGGALGRVESEVPNVLLATRAAAAAVMKKPSAAKAAMKKPAAAPLKKPSAAAPSGDEDEPEEAEEEAADEDEAEAVEEAAEAEEATVQKYVTMWYKNHNCVGIRQRYLGKKQVASVGGKACKKSRTELEKIANQLIAKLEGGSMCEADGKEWARAQT